MDIVQASFQASFDSRVERLGDVDLADLRVIFRYFDTDGDGAVSADQGCRMFALVEAAALVLGLDVNATQVRELGEVYLNEFIKIVDSHVQTPAPVPAAAAEASEADVMEPPIVEGETPAQPVTSAGETERKLCNEKVLEDEWKLLDSYRRGRVSMQELRLFLASVQSTLSLDDTERFLETYGNAIEYEAGEELELTKEGFLKFRHEYTPKKVALSEEDASSDEDDERELTGHTGVLGQRAPEIGPSDVSQAANGVNDAPAMRLPSRHAERGPSNDTQSASDHMLSSRDHEFVVNPDELVESDESDEEAAAGNNDQLLVTDDGHDTARS
ncbi:hypothetical protein PR001_g10868 [Phytophthora rubi]|uniref:EF-hand domain-containing protein n=1 Tax=Phytophthora rubi TaxID=129364 RepID=A0A6A3MLQ1_9STRA|nr:hypothetical protein PR001_g10868 [Phytophthora rubi]